MLVAMEGGVLRLFPAWPATEPARFAGLRTKGAFLVAAGYSPDSGVNATVTITSTAGGACLVLDPWPPRTPPGSSRARTHSRVEVSVATMQSSGTTQAAVLETTWRTDADPDGFFVLAFDTVAGARYSISHVDP